MQHLLYPLSHNPGTTILSEICYGPMKSGKSRRLVQHAEAFYRQQWPFLVFKPRQDTRDGAFIRTRDPGYRNVEALIIDSASDILDFISAVTRGRNQLLKMVEKRRYRGNLLPNTLTVQEYLAPVQQRILACIVDEIFLLDSGIIQVKEQLFDIGIHVFAGGLDRDFRREYFPLADYAKSGRTMQDVIQGYPLKIWLSAKCEVCEREAEYTQRLVNSQPAHYNSPTILIGDEEYESRCKYHHCVLGHPDGEFIAEEPLSFNTSLLGLGRL